MALKQGPKTPTPYSPYHDDEPLSEDREATFIPPPPESKRSTRKIIALIFTIVFLLSLAGNLLALPSLRMYEDIICRQYYAGVADHEQHSVDEEMCKGEEVQNQLNILFAVSGFLGAIPGIFCTIPYGLLADRIGRKPVFLLSMFGMVLYILYSFMIMFFSNTIPVRMLWLSPLFVLIGGGHGVAVMMFYAIGSDVTTDSNRANVFMLGGCAGIVAEIIGPSIASFLMRRTPWLPLLTGLVLFTLAALPILWIPETAHLRPSSPPSFVSKKRSSFVATLREHISDGIKRILESAKVLNSLPILLLLIPFSTDPFCTQAIGLTIRYISKRFGWKIADTAFILSLRSVAHLILLAAILPSLSYFLTDRRQFSAREKDVSLARLSILLLVLGALLIAIAPSITLAVGGLLLLTLGTGFTHLIRSLITTLVDKDHIARLYSAIAVVEMCSSLLSSPIIGGLYSLGLKWKGAWIGLPYFGLAVVCVGGGMGVFLFGMLRPPKEDMPFGDEQDVMLGDAVLLSGESDDGTLIEV